MEHKKYYTASQAAYELLLATKTVTKWCRIGKKPFDNARKFGRKWRIPAKCLEKISK